MAWSLKATELLPRQYAPVGAAAGLGLRAAVAVLEQTAARTDEVNELLTRFKLRRQQAERYVEAYGRYCWPITGLEGVKLAPFHLLAAEGAVYVDRDHVWHMQALAKLAAVDPLFMATPHRVVDVDDETSAAEACSWWRELTSAGGEGMVVKPLQFIAQSKRGLVQPAVKCRGPEYHLRAGIRRSGQPAAPTPAVAGRQALARPARVRARH